MISLTNNGNGISGFHMTFLNGITISVQIGSMNYCNNRQFGKAEPVNNCDNAEIEIWDKSGAWYKFHRNSVLGYVTPNEIANIMGKVANAKSIKTLRINK